MRTTKMTVLVVLVVALFALIQTKAQVQTAPENMVLIPAGEFQMGDMIGDGYYDEIPVHIVYTDSFYIDKYEVTDSLWNEVYRWAISNGYDFDNLGSSRISFGRIFSDSKGPNYPVTEINWFDAIKWCNARSEKEGRIPAYYTDRVHTIVYHTGQNKEITSYYVKWKAGYRLPTEAEWEKTARGGVSGHRFSWADTDTITHDRANYSSDWAFTYDYDVSLTRGFHPAYYDYSLYKPIMYLSPVGSFAPNNYGLYDTTGNVFEWCWDRAITYESSTYDDPQGNIVSSYRFRALRGGSWSSDANWNRVSFRNDKSATNTFYQRSYDLGFRTVLGSTTAIAKTPEWKQAIEIQPKQPTYSEAPKKEDTKDSLVLVTHGWQPAFRPVDIAWVEEMTNAITSYLTANQLDNWQVSAYRWVEKASTFDPESVLRAGEQEGKNLGQSIATKEWKNVHLIAHSAGSALIQSATEKIKDKWTNTIVHLTFLDPYVGVTYNGRKNYGSYADWAENYFTRDLKTSWEIFSFTEGALKNAYNVDVTFLDKTKTTGDVYFSSSGTVIQQCQEATTKHSWPYEFYTQTILPNTVGNSKGFGFPLSKEGGGWDFAKSQYAKGNISEVLGTPDPSCLPTLFQTTPAYLGQISFSTTSSTTSSPTGVVEKNDFGFNLVSLIKERRLQSLKAVAPSEGPAWLATTVLITNAVNLVSFDSRFLNDAKAEGLLSVYWDTNVIGTIDERVAPSEMHQYTFSVPRIANGIQTIGFRLDSFSDMTSSVTVTNVSLGFIGVKEPFFLSSAGSQTDGVQMLQLTGQKDFNYTVETSTDLINWEVFAILVNTDGVVKFNSAPPSKTAHFYRAVAQ
ncbi:MAG: formylglycine-generating enzyme family protein [Patescibacteria group bacterium]|nr:formylglycine-generating enzyme family protein [Patescibacteria group bacterium]